MSILGFRICMSVFLVSTFIIQKQDGIHNGKLHLRFLGFASLGLWEMEQGKVV